MQRSDFKDSFFQALDMMTLKSQKFTLFVFFLSLSNFVIFPSLLIPSLREQGLTQQTTLAFQLFGGLLSVWVTISLWLYIWTEQKITLAQCFQRALTRIPSFILYAIAYSFLMLVSLLLFIFPFFIVGPLLHFMPYVAFLGLHSEQRGVIKTTRDLTRGQFGALFFFFVFFLLTQFYVQALDVLTVHGLSSLIAVFGLIAGSAGMIFIEFWAAFYLKARHLRVKVDDGTQQIQ